MFLFIRFGRTGRSACSLRPAAGGFILALAALADDGLKITFDDAGLAAIVHRSVELARPDEPRLRIQRVTWGEGTGADPTSITNPSPLRQAFDVRAKRLTQDYDWGRLECSYVVAGSRLDFLLSLSNAATEPLTGCEISLVSLLLPNVAANAGERENLGWFGGNVYVHARGTVGVVNWEHERGATVFLDRRRGPYGARAVSFDGPRPENRAHHPVVDDAYFYDPGRPIRPGTTERFRVSLAFGLPGATLAELCPKRFQAYARAHPVRLEWPDRRPIGQVFLGTSRTGWETNPRGFRFGKERSNDVTTEDGLREFGSALDRYADECLARLKSLDAQGVLFWDIEGQEMPHPISYVGDPRELPRICPEMDRFADPFMRKFRDAGFRTGVTIRPTEIYVPEAPWLFENKKGEKRPVRFSQRPVKDPVATMSAKIAYAQRRWGCTLFYVDSNTFSDSWLSTAQQKEKRGVPRIMPVAMVQELHRRHPDCLIIPEHSDQLLYYTCCAPYSHFSLTGTDLLRRLWPAAFRTVVWDRDLLATRMGWDACVRQVQEGDILLFQAFRDAPENELVRWIYREAGYRRRGQADSLARAKPSTLAKKAGDPGEATRFAVASALGQRPETWNPTILASLLDDASPLVRQRTLLTLAQGQTFNDPALITRLGSWLQEAPSPCDDFLRPFAADALARAGGAAVPLLTDLLRQNKPGQAPSTWPLALRALGQTGARTEEVTRSVLAFLDAQPPDPRAEQRRAAIEAAGLLRLPSAVPSLTNLLRTSAGDETVDQAVIIALGRIGERSSVEDLLKYWEATHRHTATRNALNEALAAITGQNEVWNAEEWRRWWTTGGDSP